MVSAGKAFNIGPARPIKAPNAIHVTVLMVSPPCSRH
jgi:hypothetical protein